MSDPKPTQEQPMIVVHCTKCGKEQKVPNRIKDHAEFALAICPECSED